MNTMKTNFMDEYPSEDAANLSTRQKKTKFLQMMSLRYGLVVLIEPIFLGNCPHTHKFLA
jgi:hypothetical protein